MSSGKENLDDGKKEAPTPISSDLASPSVDQKKPPISLTKTIRLLNAKIKELEEQLAGTAKVEKKVPSNEGWGLKRKLEDARRCANMQAASVINLRKRAKADALEIEKLKEMIKGLKTQEEMKINEEKIQLDQIKELKSTNCALEKQLTENRKRWEEEAKADRSSLETNLAEQKNKYKEKNEELIAVKGELVATKEGLSKVKASLGQNEQFIDTQAKSFASERETLVAGKKVIQDNFAKASESWKLEKENLEKELNSIKSTSESYKAEKERLEKELKDSQSWKSEKKKLEIELKTLENKLETQLESWKSEKEALEKELKALQDKLEAQKAKMDAISDREKELKSKEDIQSVAEEEYRKNREKLEHELEKVRAQLKDTEKKSAAKIQALSKELKSKEEALNQRGVEVKLLHSEVSNWTQKHTALKSEIDEQAAKLLRVTSKRDSLGEEVKSLKERIKSMELTNKKMVSARKREGSQIASELAKVQGLYKSCSINLDRTNGRLEKTQNEVEKGKSQLNRANARVLEMKESSVVFETENNRLKREVKSLLRRTANLEKRTKLARDSESKIKKEREDVDKQIALLKDMVRSLKIQLRRKKSMA